MNNYSCPVQASIEIIGGKWKIYILYHLLAGTKRFGELKRAIPAITQKVLTQQLRELESDGIILRVSYPEVPPKVEYSLTALGRRLESVFQTLCAWGSTFLEENGMILFDNKDPVTTCELVPADN